MQDINKASGSTLSDSTLSTVSGNGTGSHPNIIKVSAHSRSTAVAGAIAGIVREHGRAYVQAIGAAAVNQATKATAIARSYLEQDGLNIVCIPTFVEIDIDEQERTALRFLIEPR